MESSVNFWENNGEAQPASEDDILEAERRLGVKLPGSFVELLKTNNGGTPANEIYTPGDPLSIDEDDIWPLEQVYPLEDIEDLKSLGESGWAPNDSFEDGIENPRRLFVFSNLSDRFWCLDYRNCERDEEPRVQFVYADHFGKPRVVLLADCFETFLHGLHDKGG